MRAARKVYKAKLKESQLYEKLGGLIRKCKNTSENDHFLGAWYSDQSAVAWEKTLRNAFALSQCQEILLRYESFIVIERLSV